MNLFYQKTKTPVGSLSIVSNEDMLIAVLFQTFWKKWKKQHPKIAHQETKIIRLTKRQLDEYFRGKRKVFDLPYQLHGTPFQRKVWKKLVKIPYGKTRTYKQQAQLIGARTAVRAVGAANGANPISIILPCHRVIGSNGSLHGYAGGLHAKKFLLQFENPFFPLF